MNIPFEIIFSENGSTDNTINLIQTFINDKNNCFMISNDYANYGLALKNGFENAKNEIVISFDRSQFFCSAFSFSESLNFQYLSTTGLFFHLSLLVILGLATGCIFIEILLLFNLKPIITICLFG